MTKPDTTTATPREYLHSGRTLTGMSLDKIVLRPGALTILANPSRMGNSLFHVDGRIEKIDQQEAP